MHVDTFSCIWIHVNTCIAERTSARFARSGVDVVRLCGGMLGPKTQVAVQNLSSWGPKSIKLGSKIHQVGLQSQEKSIKLGSKIHQVGLQNQEKSVLGGLWRGLGAILAHLGPQDPPKTKIYPQNQFLGPLLGTHFGGQNLPKINFLGFQEVLIF